MTSSTALDGKTSDFPLGFTLPDGFQEVDLAATPASRADRLLDSLEKTLPELTGEEKLHLVFANQYSVERMVAGGVIYAANFVGRSDVDLTAATTAQFSVLLLNGMGNASRPLEVAEEALRKEGKQREVQFIDLKIGRCLAVVEDAVLQAPVDVLGQANDDAHRVRQMQIMFPVPDRGQLAVFALSTQFLRDWDDYVDLMAQICKTFRWTETEGGSVSAALDGW
jgi:hypothetical protein